MALGKPTCTNRLFSPHGIALLFLFLPLLLSPGCSRNNDKKATVLADVGRSRITRSDFNQRFTQLKREIGIDDNGQTRKQLLSTMIDEELLLQEARNRGYNRDALAREQMERLREKALLDAYSRKHLLSNITVSEEELEDLYIHFNTTITARHLLAQTFAQASQLRQRLLDGESFEDLAIEVFSDPVLRSNGGLLPSFTVDDTELPFEEAAFDLPVGEISHPIALKHGFSILRVESRTTTPLLTHQQFAEKRQKMEAFLRQRKLRQAAQQHTEAICSDELGLQFNKNALKELYQILPQPNDRSELQYASSNARQSNHEILSASGQSYTAQECLTLLEEATPSEWEWITGPEELEKVLAGILVRHTMLKHAENEGLEKDAEYRSDLRERTERFLLKRIQDTLQATQPIPIDSLHSFFVSHQSLFNRPEAIQMQGIRVTGKGRATLVEQLLQDGAPFATVAESYSEDNESAQRGGLLGLFTLADLGPEVRDVWNLKAGQWHGPVELQHDEYAFFGVVEHFEALDRDFEKSIPDIEKQYRRELGQQLVSSFCDKRRREVSITVHEDRLLQGRPRVEGQP